MEMARFVPHEMKTSLIKVVSYAGKNPTGYVVNPYYKQEMYFDNLTQLIFLIDDMLNALSYPQESMERRSFSDECTKGNRASHQPEQVPKQDILASFKVNVLFRQNASWQGSIVWVEKKAESQFRSALELIMLLDSVLTGAA